MSSLYTQEVEEFIKSIEKNTDSIAMPGFTVTFELEEYMFGLLMSREWSLNKSTERPCQTTAQTVESNTST